MRLRQYLLNQQRVDIDHAVLNQMQSKHADFVVFRPITNHFSASGEEHEVCGRNEIDASEARQGSSHVVIAVLN